MKRDRRSFYSMLFLFLAVALLINRGGARASDLGEHVAMPYYAGWPLEQEATTYRPGTDLQFYALELKIYVNPKNQAEMVVELRRHDVLYILYHYMIREGGPRWAIYMDEGFANAPCGFFDLTGTPTGRYIRIHLRCLRDTERADKR
ncbi:MAG: hypothetical protein ACE5JU_10605 [Candidatus Binatia bacterium]